MKHIPIKKNKKFFIPTICICLLMILSVSVSARSEVDVDKSSSLVLSYKYNDIAFESIEISIYHVADFTISGEFVLRGDFASYPIDVKTVKTQLEWNKIASTLDAYTKADKLVPTAKATTDKDGNAVFSNLKVGLYLVIGCRAEYAEGYCDYNTFLISVPGLDENEEWIYDVVAKPKISHHEITGKDIEYTVTKLWKDTGYEEKRPKSVEVAIYKDGQKVETITLNKENNWTYTWKAKDDGSRWTTVESKVPEGYYVTFETNGNTFIITNTYDGETPPPPPPTGDSANLYFMIITMSILGAAMIILGIGKGRRKER